MGKCSFIDLTGKRSGRLFVVSRAENGKYGQPRWNCICDCGKKTVSYGPHLRVGMYPGKYSSKVHSSRSCGCLQKEIARVALLAANTTHGQCKTLRYQMWVSAKIRAARDRVPFKLEFADFPEIPERCPVLGIPLVKNSRYGPHSNSPTLDRIVPELGYVPGNIKIISHRANTIKSDATVAEILAVAKYVIDNTQSKNCVLFTQMTDQLCIVH